MRSFASSDLRELLPSLMPGERVWLPLGSYTVEGARGNVYLAARQLGLRCSVVREGDGYWVVRVSDAEAA